LIATEATADLRTEGQGEGDEEATGTGLATSVAVTVLVEPSLCTTLTATRSPGPWARISDPRSSCVFTGLPSNPTMTSPTLMPALSAGPPGAVWTTSA